MEHRESHTCMNLCYSVVCRALFARILLIRAEMQETAFERNSGEIGGAVMLADGSSSSFSHCTFAGNTAASGSAVAVRPGARVDEIASCSFSRNWQQSEMRVESTGRMIDPSREYNDRTLEIFAERCDKRTVYLLIRRSACLCAGDQSTWRCRMGLMRFEDTLVFQMTRQPATSTLGGTVDAFRSCVMIISNSTFCNNGIISAAMLPSKGALVLQSPTCETEVVQTLFADNHVHTSGAAMLVRSSLSHVWNSNT